MPVIPEPAELPAADCRDDNVAAVQPPQAQQLYRQLERAGAEIASPEDGAVHRYVIVGDGDISDSYWGRLWELREQPRVHTAIASLVVPQCPLLSAERATTIVSRAGLLAPENSAWITMGVDLARFATGGRAIDEAALRRALETCVDVGEKLHDVLCWAKPDARHDAWLNRRLAVVVSGMGDLLRLWDMQPTCHDGLRCLNQLLLRVRATLKERSRVIASGSERLPAITLSDPSHLLPRGGVREDWRRRWREAVEANLVRHRNLLVLSPWALFPGGDAADCRYTELLPLLRHADACAFRKTVSIAHWKLKEFKCFHQRTKAVLHQRSAASPIAHHV